MYIHVVGLEENLQEFKNVCVRENIMGGHEDKHHHEYISGS
jgi:hypothetical protein